MFSDMFSDVFSDMFSDMLTCNHLVRVPDNDSKLPRGRLAWRDVHLQSGLDTFIILIIICHLLFAIYNL